MTWNTYQRSLEREFPAGTVVAKAQGGGVDITIPCKHGHRITESFKMHMPPDKAKRVFINKGWRFWGKSTTCPDHTRKDDAMALNTLNDAGKAAAMAGTSSSAVAAAQPVASESAREAKRMAILILEDKFDVKKGHYKDTYSDLKVARDVQLSEEAIASLREDLFGPIKEPAEISELREKTASFEERIAAVEREMSASNDAFNKVLRELHEDAAKMKGRLAVLATRNGW